MMDKGRYAEIKQGLIAVFSKMNVQYGKSLDILIEEVYKRIGVQLEIIDDRIEDDGNCPVIVTALKEDLVEVRKTYGNFSFEDNKLKDEGYYISISVEKRIEIYVIGADYKGILFGIGKLLRSIYWNKNSFGIKNNLKILSNPTSKLRGQQLGYRPKTNAYDAWDEAQYEQYIRELAIFGTNAIELIPPRSDDDLLSRHMKVKPLEMLIKTANIIDSYGLDVCLWYPNVGGDYKSQEGIDFELAEREEIFSKMPAIKELFIPGGDPGELNSDHFFEWSDKIAEVLNKYHPEAKIWISPQNFLLNTEWVEYFYKKTNEKPNWLGGIVFGPWERDSVEVLREKISDDIPIRNYPDITHSYFAQYAVPDWDISFALSQGRECINPRPAAMKRIHNETTPYTIGSITYSEGINDDVNKFIWAMQDWDPKTAVYDTLKEYSSLFISSEYADDITQAIMLLEENWEGPILVNPNITRTNMIWNSIENKLTDAKDNYRLKLCLLRASYDAYIKRRLIYETEMEEQVLDILQKNLDDNLAIGVKESLKIIDDTKNSIVGQDLRIKCYKLSDELFELIGAQFSVKKHDAIKWQRGAFMDDLERQLNDFEWLEDELLKYDGKKVSVQNIIDTKYGIGNGYYDNLGTFNGMKRISNKLDWKKDTGYRTSPLAGFATPLTHREIEGIETGPIPLSWISNMCAYTTNKVKLKYENLCPDSAYLLKVKYMGYQYGQRRSTLNLTANDNYVVHDFIDIKSKSILNEYVIPAEIIRDGVLEMAWESPDGYQGPSVAEIWMEKY